MTEFLFGGAGIAFGFLSAIIAAEMRFVPKGDYREDQATVNKKLDELLRQVTWVAAKLNGGMPVGQEEN